MKSLRYLFRIGPGPSSSHTIGPKRACEYILKLYPNSNKFIVNLYGSLALTGKGHLTDYIIKKTRPHKKSRFVHQFIPKGYSNLFSGTIPCSPFRQHPKTAVR